MHFYDESTAENVGTTIPLISDSDSLLTYLRSQESDYEIKHNFSHLLSKLDFENLDETNSPLFINDFDIKTTRLSNYLHLYDFESFLYQFQ